MPGDVIYFPAIGPLAAVSGSVNHPAIFELRGDTSLGTLLHYAGGLSTTARSRQITNSPAPAMIPAPRNTSVVGSSPKTK